MSGDHIPVSTDRTTALRGAVTAIAEAYLVELREMGSPLVSSRAAVAARGQRARSLVAAALEDLGYPCGVDELRVAEDWSVLCEFRAGRVPAEAGTESTHRLFELAMRGLLPILDDDPVRVATCLSRRLWAPTVAALSILGESGVLEQLTTEVVDRERLRSMVTDREAAVFDLLLVDAPVAQIAARLQITESTAKQHVNHIGHKFSASGRSAILSRARELQVLVAVPLMLFGGSLADTITATASNFL